MYMPSFNMFIDTGVNDRHMAVKRKDVSWMKTRMAMTGDVLNDHDRQCPGGQRRTNKVFVTEKAGQVTNGSQVLYGVI